MTAHISKPFVHVEDSNGNPYVGAKLYVYDVATTNLKSIYSDIGLSVAIANPLTSDAAGNFARAYVASGTYKLRAETSAGVLIWEYDYIDTGLTSGSGALAITAGGTGATTASAARTSLGAAAQTDVDDLATDIATLSSSLQNIVSIPQGRLTPTTATPVIATGVTAGTSVYYTPYTGNLVPIYDGTQFNTSTFAELTLTLNSNHTASSIYDVYIWKESGVVTIGTGPAWNTATAGSGARGSGAGTTELTRTNGLWTNANSMTTRNGATTYTVAANRGTYVGTLYIDGTNGQITCHVAWGQSRKFGVWNAYNRREIILRCGDSTATWNYNTNTRRQSRADAGNQITVLAGLAEEPFDTKFAQFLSATAAGGTTSMNIGIGWNSTTVASGTLGTNFFVNGPATSSGVFATFTALYTAPPALGINNVIPTELTPSISAGSNAAFAGTEANMLLSARWQG